MIELLLKAENALSLGMLEQAERVYWQAIEHDPRNAIAIVGLSRVALERGDEWTALDFAARALVIDPDNATARRLIVRLTEVIQRRGDGPRGMPTIPTVQPLSGDAAMDEAMASVMPPQVHAPTRSGPEPGSQAAPAAPAEAPPGHAPGDDASAVPASAAPATPGDPPPGEAEKRRLLTRLFRRP
jgi:tetratricopeptide (TPR) repeat protein